MQTIEFSTMLPAHLLQLDRFEQETGVPVRYQNLSWEDAWQRVMQVGLTQRGADVSQVGTTWVENLRGLRALRPFLPEEIEAISGPQGGQYIGLESEENKNILSLPWLLDTRLVYYRKDLLANAGVDEATAFETPQALLDTLERLRASGVAHPLVMPTRGQLIHYLASFVWAGGGRFRTPDGRKMTLLEPNALDGVRDYFLLAKYLHPGGQLKDSFENETIFFEGQAAVLISGYWISSRLRRSPEVARPEVLANLGLALPPGGIPFLGGSHLVIWRHSLPQAEDLALLRHLLSPALLVSLTQAGFGLPARVDVFQSPALKDDPLYAPLLACIQRGRAMNSTYRWAAVEGRINDFVVELWASLAANPALPVEAEVRERLEGLCERLEHTLLAG